MQFFKTASAAGLALGGMLTLAACNAEDNVAIVNGVPIPQARMDYVVKTQVQQGQQDNEQLRKQVKDALRRKPDIISLSAGTPTRHNKRLLAIKRIREIGMWPDKTILVAAAGNDDTDRRFYPAAFKWAYSVGSIDPDGQKSDFSNYGDWVDAYDQPHVRYLLESGEFPMLSQALTLGEPPRMQSFETGLQWLLDGFEASLRR